MKETPFDKSPCQMHNASRGPGRSRLAMRQLPNEHIMLVQARTERPGRWAALYKETTYEPEPSGALFLDPAALTNARDVFPSSWRMPLGSRRRWWEWLCIKRVFVMAQCLRRELLFRMRWFDGVQECLDWECFTERILAGLRKRKMSS